MRSENEKLLSIIEHLNAENILRLVELLDANEQKTQFVSKVEKLLSECQRMKDG